MSMFSDLVEEYPIITTVKNETELHRALNSPSNIIFVLFGNICNIKNIVDTAKSYKKLVLVHIDLVEGLQNNEYGIRYIKDSTSADGIITTRIKNIKIAKENKLIAVQRFFLIDSLSLESTISHLKSNNCDAVEILPGVMPKIIKKLTKHCRVPLIAGGLISDKEDVMTVLSAGATAVSTTDSSLWNL